MNESSIAAAQAQHSLLPWKNRSEPNETLLAFIYDADGKIIASLKTHDFHLPAVIQFKQIEANAAFIVRACNNAQRLADALKRILHSDAGSKLAYGCANEAADALAQWEKAQ